MKAYELPLSDSRTVGRHGGRTPGRDRLGPTGQLAANTWSLGQLRLDSNHLGGCLLPAVGEEVMFRGFLGRGLLARYGLAGGTLLSAMFSLMHADPVQALAVLVLGITLQGVYIATRSLFAPMLLHGLNNALAFGLAIVDPESLDPAEISAMVAATINSCHWRCSTSEPRYVSTACLRPKLVSPGTYRPRPGN